MEVGLVLISSTSTSRCAKVNKVFLVLIIPNMTHIAGFTKAWMVNQIDKNQATLTDLFIYAGLAATPKFRSQTVWLFVDFSLCPSVLVCCSYVCMCVSGCMCGYPDGLFCC